MTYTYYLKILNEKEKKEIENQLNNQFGIKTILGTITMKGSERLFLFQGELNNEEIKQFESIMPIERVGVYFAKLSDNAEGIRLTLEGSQILGKQATKNIFELNKEQVENWMKGQELDVKTEKEKTGFYLMKYKDSFLATGKVSENKIGNFVPKERRLKERG